jgi:hypothetical protein
VPNSQADLTALSAVKLHPSDGNQHGERPGNVDNKTDRAIPKTVRSDLTLQSGMETSSSAQRSRYDPVKEHSNMATPTSSSASTPEHLPKVEVTLGELPSTFQPQQNAGSQAPITVSASFSAQLGLALDGWEEAVSETSLSDASFADYRDEAFEEKQTLLIQEEGRFEGQSVVEPVLDSTLEKPIELDDAVEDTEERARRPTPQKPDGTAERPIIIDDGSQQPTRLVRKRHWHPASPGVSMWYTLAKKRPRLIGADVQMERMQALWTDLRRLPQFITQPSVIDFDRKFEDFMARSYADESSYCISLDDLFDLHSLFPGVSNAAREIVAASDEPKQLQELGQILGNLHIDLQCAEPEGRAFLYFKNGDKERTKRQKLRVAVKLAIV